MKRLWVLSAALWVAVGVLAVPVAPQPGLPAAPSASHFIAPGLIDVAALLPPPPAADSVVQCAEIEVLLNLQAERTPAQVAQANRVNTEDVFAFGSDVLGQWFNATNLPQTAAFFAQVREDFIAINRSSKVLFNRRRPPFVDARIKPCVEFSDTGAYPSGHAMQSAIWAELLSRIFPEQSAALQRRASETRWSRLLGGVHYPSDVEAGRVVGDAIAREMLQNTGLQETLLQLRSEAIPHQPPR
jgi:acid phosphatase (class A)